MTTSLATQFSKQQFGHIDNFLSEDIAKQLYEEARLLTLSPGEVSSEAGYWQTERKADRRGDYISWIDVDKIPKSSAILELKNNLDDCIETFRSTCPTISDIEFKKKGKLTCERIMVANYKDIGSRFVPHIDNPNGNGRVVTFTYYIHPGYQSGSGGELCIRESINGPPISKIEPTFNRLACIDSEHVVHEVLPLLKDERWAIVVWYSLQSEDEKLEAMRTIFKLLSKKK
eukprot:TRINITY_DN33714_c0_g1_i1.p1 TRINITY_DN33714_c0_g1~~TRINITY_DN33714_c0_g1_i1.p1  ORF type:complete len:230 (+),score=47.58 TRINITY_DN33714_c0_g1_i1:66-755(+)